MQLSQIPLRMQKVWAQDASGAYIRTVPVASQIGIQDGAASYSTGFVPDNFTNVAAGGVPPFGQDFNGALNEITSWDQWVQAGGAIGYDATFAAAIGGYPKGAVLDSLVTPGAQWYSTVDNNTTNPDDPLTSANWARIGLPPGLPVPFLTSSIPDGFVLANSNTIGNAGSGASVGSPALLFVYKAIWDNFSNAQCPVITSGGVSTTRGANAVADFTALKRIVTPNMAGSGVIGCDNIGGVPSSFLTGVPIFIGNASTPGSILGEIFHALSSGELPALTPSGSIANGAITISTDGAVKIVSGNIISNSSPGGSFQTPGANITASQGASTFFGVPFGGNLGHNNVQRGMAVYWGLKT